MPSSAHIGATVAKSTAEIRRTDRARTLIGSSLVGQRLTARRLWLRQYLHLHAGGRILLVKYLLGGFLKIFRLGVGNVGKRLRIAVSERKPRALDLNHDAVTAAECVIQIGHSEVDIGLLAGHKRLRLFPARAEFRAKRLAAQ